MMALPRPSNRTSGDLDILLRSIRHPNDTTGRRLWTSGYVLDWQSATMVEWPRSG